MIRDGTLTLESTRLVIVHHDLVVITGSHNLIRTGDHLKTPNFTLKVRLDEAIFLRAFRGHHILEFED